MKSMLVDERLFEYDPSVKWAMDDEDQPIISEFERVEKVIKTYPIATRRKHKKVLREWVVGVIAGMTAALVFISGFIGLQQWL